VVLNNPVNGCAGTLFEALIAAGTLFLILPNFKQAQLFKNPGDETCGADKLTVWSVVPEARQEHHG